MFVVGVAQLSTSPQDEAPLLGQNLGLTAYEARMLLAPGIPALLLVTPDKSRAIELLTNLRSRGHDALAFDTQAVIASKDMVCPHHLRLLPEGLLVDRPEPAHLPFASIHIILRATHESSVQETVETHKRKFSAGRAVLSGGLVMTKKTSLSSSSHAYEKHEVLYVYPQGGHRPWLLRESGTRYEGLGDRLAPTERANFLTLIDLLRTNAPNAIYDDRLVGRKIPEKLTQVAIQSMASHATRVETSSDSAMDLLCHFVAMWHSKR